MTAGLLASAATAAEPRTLLRLQLDGPVPEAPSPLNELFAGLFGGDGKTLHQWIDTLQRAAKDDKIAGVVLIIESPQMSLAQAEEFSRALRELKKSGKKVHVYLDSGNNLSYAIATAGDDITIPPHSSLDTVGLRASLMFYKGLFDKLGVHADMLHCGAYKSALEPYVRTEPSPEAAENINWLLDGLFARWVGMIAENRGLDVKAVQAAIDEAPLPSERALALGLVDHVAGFPDFKKRLFKEYGRDAKIQKSYKREKPFGDIDPNNPFAFFQLINEMMEKSSKPKPAGIGLIYVDGAIVMGKSEQGGWSGDAVAGSTTVRAALEAAREDANIKAVVLRVNSPGGSAVASDIIWDAATRLAAEKPLIVSMGGVAGSGGYYVAIPGDTIFAEESTITGSIGVVGGKIVIRGLLTDKLGITVTEFERGKHAGLMSTMSGWEGEQRTAMERMLNDTYTQFKARVTQSRGKRIKGELEDLAGGRVYTGRQALERGLVDRIGGLRDALRLATEKSGLTDPKVYVLPRQPDFGDFLKKLSGEDTEDHWEIRPPAAAAAAMSSPLLDAAMPLLRELAPEQAASIRTALLNLRLLQREHVGCFMPMVPTVK
jgi:protease-4